MEKFYDNEKGAELNATKCKKCINCYDFIYCKIRGKITKDILLNKEKCNKYAEK